MQRFPSSRFYLLLSVALVVTACGRSTIFGDAVGGEASRCGSPRVDLFFAQVLTAECAALSACSFSKTDAAFLMAACASQALNGNATEIAQLTASVDAGRMAFDPCAATTCLPSVPGIFADAGICAWAGSDPDPFALPDVLYVCPEAFTGLSPVGGPCGSELDCTTGFCDNGQDFGGGFSPLLWMQGGSCLGTCQPFFQRGQPCNIPTTIVGLVPAPTCAPGLSCEGEGLTCEEPSPIGGPCGPYINGCLEGYCAFTENTVSPQGTCVPYRSLGQPCSTASYCDTACCEAGLVCADAGSCVTADVVLLGAGQPCTSPRACALPLICAGFDFLPDGGAETGTCALGHDVGGPCVVRPQGASGCLGGLVCVGGECQLPPSSGPCAIGSYWPPSSGCDLSHYCELFTDLCEPYLPAGAECLIIDAGITIGGVLQCGQGYCDESGHCAVTDCQP